MNKRKWKWLTGGAALIIMLGLALPSGLAQDEDKAEKRTWKKLFKRKAKTEVVEATEAVIEKKDSEEPVEFTPLSTEPETEDWAWDETPFEMGPGLAEPAAVSPPAQKVFRLHQVGEGENLHILAAYYYGDARSWPRIYKLNKKQIRNPNIIRMGQILKIEVKPGWKARFELSQFMEKEKKRATAIEQSKMAKPTIIRETRTIIPTITPLTELEEEEEKPRIPVPASGTE